MIENTIKESERRVDDVEVLLMLKPWTTKADGLGQRTYEAGKLYCITPGFRDECEAAPELVAQLTLCFPRDRSRPIFDTVSVIPSITRWFSSDGVDTHYLRTNVAVDVPSNLAAFLIHCNYARAA